MQRRGFLRAGSSLAFGVLSSVHWPLTASRAADNTLDNFFLRKLDRVTTDLMTETKVPGAAIALVRDGKLFWSGGFGIKSTLGEDIVDADTIFEAASVSKTVFAYEILKLRDQGKLDLDRPLTKYVPWRFLENDPRLDHITARHILSHSAGFQDWRSGDNPLKIHFTPGENSCIPAKVTSISNPSSPISPAKSIALNAPNTKPGSKSAPPISAPACRGKFFSRSA